MNNRLILIFTTVLSLSAPLTAQVNIDAKKESLYEIDLNNQS